MAASCGAGSVEVTPIGADVVRPLVQRQRGKANAQPKQRVLQRHRHIVIATGSEFPRASPGVTVDQRQVVDLTGARPWSLPAIPESMVVVGCRHHRARSSACVALAWALR